MKKAPKVRLSLRKLFIAMLAVGPVAILPSPLLAVIPTSASFTVVNGTVTATSPATGVANINATDRSILQWGNNTNLGTFTIAAGETWNFILPSGGSILNRVGNATAATPYLDTATINGKLESSGRVFVLANGAISVGNGAVIDTVGGLVLSTLREDSNLDFVTGSSLALTGAATGAITIGTINVSQGNLTAVGGTVSVGGSTIGTSVAGDLVLRSVTAASAIDLAAAATLNVAGNVSVTTNGGAISATSGISVGASTAASQTTTLNSGAGAISLVSSLNDFEVVTLNTTGTTGTVTLRDANIVTLGASTIGGDLSVTAGGRTNTNAITTSGTVVIGGNASFVSTSSANSSVNIGNSSTIAGWASAATAGGSVTLNTAGNLTLGNITTNVTATNLATGALHPTLAGTVTLAGGVITAGTLTAGTASPIYTGNVTATIASPIAAATTPAPGSGGAPVGVLPVGAVVIANGGSGYVPATATAIVVGGGGTGATASVTVTGDTVTGVSITAGGSGYTSTPLIVIAHPNTLAAPATGRAVRDSATGLVTSIEITNGGVGYGTTVPGVTFTTMNTANNFSSGGITANTTGALTTTAGVGLGTSATPSFTLLTGLRSSQGVNLTGTSVTTNSIITVTGNTTSTFVATNGTVSFGDPTITANRITVNATGGNIVQTAASILSTTNTTTGSTFNAGTGVVTLEGANAFSSTAPVHVTASSATLRSASAGGLIVGNSNITGNYSVRAEPAAAAARNVTLGFGDGGAATGITVGGVLSVTANSGGWIRDNNDSRLDVFGGLALQTGNATVAGGDITLDAATFPGVLTPSVRFGQVNANTGLAGAAITLAESTTLNLGNIAGASLTASSATGGIIDTGSIVLAAGGAGTFTVNSTNSVVLDTTTSVIPVLNFAGGVNNSATGLAGNVVLASATGTGNTTVSTNTGLAVSLGGITTTGDVIVNSGSYIDIVGNANITGNLTLVATGNIPSAATLTSSGVTFGSVYAPTSTINNTSGRLTGVAGSNLQALTYATAPTVTVSGGSLPTTAAAAGVPTITNGIVTAIPVAAGGSGYVFAPTVTLSAPGGGGVTATATAVLAGGVITGYTVTNAGSGYAAAPTVTLSAGGGNATVPATVDALLGANGQITGFNVTNSASNGGSLPYNTANTIGITLAGATTTSITESAGTLKVSGTTSITAPGSAQLFRGNDFSNVVLNAGTGNALINDVNALTVSGTASGNVDARSGANGTGTIGTAIVGSPVSEANPWVLTLGNLNVGSLNATASNGGAGNSGGIAQASGTAIGSFGRATFTTTNNTITIGNNGNNFGRVEAFSNAGASVNIVIVEDGTMKVGNLTGRGNATLTSRFGSIIEDSAADVVITNNGTLTLNSPSGSINIGNTTHTVGTTTGNVVTVVASAPNGAVAVQSSANLTLGNITGLSLTVSSGNNILQTGAARIFGASNFTATNNISLTNVANNFGRVSLTSTSAGGNIAITEGGTLNIGTVAMGGRGDATTNAAAGSGLFTATSVSGDIIDTGLGGAKFGGLIAPAGSLNANALLTGTGAVTLSAVNGNIVLDDPTTDFHSIGGLVFNAKDVTLAPLGQVPVVLGAPGTTSTANNLTVRSAIGSIANAGNITVTGDAFFQTGAGNINMGQAGNRFGTVQFAGNAVTIRQANDINIVRGSSAIGAAVFDAGTYITIDQNKGTGIVTFGSTVEFNAVESIVLPKLMQAAGTVTVNSAGTKNLSALSQAADLAGRAPINLGTGTYLAPQP